MPTSPKRACPVCRKLGCVNPDHVPKEPGGHRTPRPEYRTSKERRRRAQAVRDWLSIYGERIEDGRIVAVCPDCGQPRMSWVADHVVPLSEGGTEHGMLRIHCQVCSGRQGARIRNELRKQRP